MVAWKKPVTGFDEEGMIAEVYTEVLSESSDKNMVIIHNLVVIGLSSVQSHYINR
jgi:hypothetical protein